MKVPPTKVPMKVYGLDDVGDTLLSDDALPFHGMTEVAVTFLSHDALCNGKSPFLTGSCHLSVVVAVEANAVGQ